MPVQTTYDVAPAVAVAGKLACRMADAQVDTMFSGESSAKVLFGRAVMYGSATDGKNAKLPVAETAQIAGIVCHLETYENGENGELTATGVAPGGKLNVLRKGVIWVKVEDAVVPGDRLWVRGVAGGDPEFLGGLLPADDGTDTVDCTMFGQFKTPAGAGELAKLAVNFP